MADIPASLKWPLEFQSDGDLEVVEGANDVGQALTFQAMTQYQEIPLTEDGSDIQRRAVFEQNDDVLEATLKDAMKQAVRRTLVDVEIAGFNFTFNRGD